MSEPIQRWRHYIDTGMQPAPEGEWVLAADAEAHEAAAVAAARAEEREKYARPTSYEQGQRDERARIRATVTDLLADPTDGRRPRWGLADVLAVIDAALQDGE